MDDFLQAFRTQFPKLRWIYLHIKRQLLRSSVFFHPCPELGEYGC